MQEDALIQLFKVNKDVPIPLYYQIKQSILAAIQSEMLQGGDMIPSEQEFCDKCDVSRPTIRQALSELVSEGLLYRQKGKGTYVSVPKIDARFLNKLQSFDQEMIQKGLTPCTKVLSLRQIEGVSSINNRFNAPCGQKLIYLERLRFTDGKPIVYLETYLPYEPFKDLLNQDFELHSLYSLLEDRYYKKVESVIREIEAVNATQHEADLLHIAKNKALCLVKTVAYTSDKVPVEYSVARYRGDRNKFSVELYR